MMLHTVPNIKGLGLLLSDKKIFAYEKNWPFCKKGHGERTVIMFSNIIGPISPMLHTKPQGHEDFLKILPYMGNNVNILGRGRLDEVTYQISAF